MSLIKKDVISNEDGSIGYVECIYESSNILKTIYFPYKKKLFISFSRGGTYSYMNVDEDLYKNFENADSSGKFFIQNIQKNSSKYPYAKEFTLYPNEIDEVKKIISEEKNKKNEKPVN